MLKQEAFNNEVCCEKREKGFIGEFEDVVKRILHQQNGYKSPSLFCFMRKFIFVSGGVISGVGKGIATASIGRILQEYGYKVTAVKIDPYINIDAGTMRPTEHGEVWVTADGGEIDQDLGNYERFLNLELSRRNNITTGQIYQKIIAKERAGEFLGKTVQFIPHVPEEVKNRILESGGEAEIVLVEIGGTVGDYENTPFLFAAKNFEREFGRENVLHVLVSYLPIPHHISEAKTKPTQQAIKMLGEHGIFPDFILCRAREPLDEPRKSKIETYANIEKGNVISAPDVLSIYEVPLNYERDEMGRKILKRLGLEERKIPDWSRWKEFLRQKERTIRVAVVCKYIDIGRYSLEDSYVSVKEALKHAAMNAGVSLETEWLNSKELEEQPERIKTLSTFDGVIVPGGFGASGVEGKISAIRFCRENNVPFLGLCYGLQLAVAEFARNVCNLEEAHTTEVNKETRYPVIDLLPSQKELMEKSQYGGTMRLGSYAAEILEGSKVFDCYTKTGRLLNDARKVKELPREKLGLSSLSSSLIIERHRHRYEVNPSFVEIIKEKGLIISGVHLRTDGQRLVEFIELPAHPFFTATQAHPEFKSSLEDPAPLFLGFVEACKKRRENISSVSNSLSPN